MINFPQDPARLAYDPLDNEYQGPWQDANGKEWTWGEAKQRWEPYLSTATSFAELTDKATADLPAINGPLAAALDLKADAADLGTAAATDLLDDDTLGGESSSATAVPSQQSVKAYVDNNTPTVDNAAVNAAISTNPSASRAALQVGSDPTKYNPGTITRFVYAGDSITANILTAASGGKVTQNAKLWPWWIQMVSGREFAYTPNGTNQAFAASGNRVSDFISTYLPTILALSPLPSHCVMQYGTNHCPDPVDTFIADYTSAIDQLRAGGVEPIIMTPPSANAYSGYTASGVLEDDVLNPTRGSVIAEMTEALIDLCIEKGVALIDNRQFVELPNVPGESPKGTHQEGDLGGIHPWDGWHHAVAQNAAKRLRAWGATGDEILEDFTVLNSEPNFETTTPTITAGQNQTTAAALVAREDGFSGNLLEVHVQNNGTKQHGTSSGALYTPNTGYTAKDFEVCIINKASYYGVGGTSGTPTSTPAIAVEKCLRTNKWMILIKPPRHSGAGIFNTTIQDIVDAINNHPKAGEICTASAIGTASAAWPYSTAGTTTMPPCTFSTVIPTDPAPATFATAAEAAIADTDEVRFAVEIWQPKGASHPGFALGGYSWDGDGYDTLNGNMSKVASETNACAVGLLSGRSVYFTPWIPAGTSRRFYCTVTFGGAEGIYRFGRAQIQTRTP